MSNTTELNNCLLFVRHLYFLTEKVLNTCFCSNWSDLMPLDRPLTDIYQLILV